MNEPEELDLGLVSAPGSPGTGVTEGSASTSLRVTTKLRDAISSIYPAGACSVEDKLSALVAFYKSRTHYQFATEAEDIEIDIQALEGTVFSLNNATLELVEATRRLIELKESGLLHALDLIIADSKRT